MSESSEQHFAIAILVLIVLVLLYAYIGNLLEHLHIHIIHETGVGILIGFVFGLVIYFIHDLPDFEFSEQIFFYGLLPPMIFSGGYNLKKSTFFQNFTYISLYGALGTVMTFGVIFGLTFLINKLHWIREWSNINTNVVLSTSLIIKYSATICASDSVAALTMIKPNKYPKLFAIVFGEGMVNDAVAIILFNVLGDIFDHHTDKSAFMIVLGILGDLLLDVVTSLAIGLACALACTLVFKHSQFLTSNPVIEVTMLYLFGFMSYVIAEIFDMSGVITVLVCGISLSHFNFYNLSTTGKIATGVTFQTISFIAQAFVFIYLGISTMFYYKSNSFSYTFVLLELVICAFARFFSIFSLSYICKRFMKKWNVSFYELLIITVAGIIRGSVAFALILTLKKEEEGDKSVSIVQSSVMLMVFITTLSLGAAMPSFITGCLKKDKANAEENPLLEQQQKEKKEKKKSGMAKFDEEYMKPFFIYDYENRKEEIKEFKKLLKINSPDYKGGEYTGIMRATVRNTVMESQLHQGKDSLFTDEDMK